MQDDNAMNDRLAELRKLQADLAKLEKEREFWHDEAGRISRALAKEREDRPSPGATCYGHATALERVSTELLAYARRVWEAGETISPDSLRSIALQLRTEAGAAKKAGEELDRIAQEGAE